MNDTLESHTVDTDQSATLMHALCAPEAYPHEISKVKIIETHISRLLLTGNYVYKIKKPVNFGFLDFSSLEKRHFYCQEELRLNQRLSKNLYLEVVPITGSYSQPKISGSGNPIEYAVKMRQFPTGGLLSEFATQKILNASIIDELALLVAEFHQNTEVIEPHSMLGSAHTIKHWFNENFQHIHPLLSSQADKIQLETIKLWGKQEWRRNAGLFQIRLIDGFIRSVHGDLHLSNITLYQGTLTAFDCIEFNPMLRCIDVQNDIAFLLIDLWFFDYPQHAYRFLNRYLQLTGDYAGLQVLPYYLVYRALVLAKVALLRRTQQQQQTEVTRLYQEYKKYLFLAEQFTQAPRVMLIITHGFSGAGKSVIAEQVANRIGAIWLRSDVERKRLFGYAPLADTDSAIDGGVYSKHHTRETYKHLEHQTREILSAGFSVIIDATFLKQTQRKPFQKLAETQGNPFIILSIEASEPELCRRIELRQNDASEATIAVLHRQQGTAEPLSTEESAHTLTINSELTPTIDSIVKDLLKISTQSI